MSSEFSVTREEFKTLAIVVVLGICSNLGIDIHLASMPHIMSFMHTNQQKIQQYWPIRLQKLVKVKQNS